MLAEWCREVMRDHGWKVVYPCQKAPFIPDEHLAEMSRRGFGQRTIQEPLGAVRERLQFLGKFAGERPLTSATCFCRAQPDMHGRMLDGYVTRVTLNPLTLLCRVGCQTTRDSVYSIGRCFACRKMYWTRDTDAVEVRDLKRRVLALFRGLRFTRKAELPPIPAGTVLIGKLWSELMPALRWDLAEWCPIRHVSNTAAVQTFDAADLVSPEVWG